MPLFPDDKVTAVLSWIEQLRGDERVMIIIASSRMDDLLRQMLEKVMVHQPGGVDSLFDADRPLGSFSSRILLSYRLGLIDRDYESFLQAIRKLRNDAAHAAQHMNLFTTPHIDRILHLHSLASKAPMWPMMHEETVDPHADPGRSLFRSLVIGVLVAECALWSAEPFSSENAVGFHVVGTNVETEASEDSA